jgi:Transposase and inactivated derivatives, IS30 family
VKYNHLTIEERYHIQALKSVGYKQFEIAKKLNRDKSTISRELQRNSSSQTQSYSAKAANSVCSDRRMYASRYSNKKMCLEVEAWISYYILEDYSPEQASAILNIRNNIDISLVRIYQFIEEDRRSGGELYKHLRFYHTGKRRAKYGMKYKGKVKDRVSISQRPDIVDKKLRIGDFEIDTIVGSNQKGAITTAVDRVSYLIKISSPTTKEASAVEAELTRMLNPIKDRIKTITSDNGLEFYTTPTCQDNFFKNLIP